MAKIYKSGISRKRLLFKCRCGCLFSTYAHETKHRYIPMYGSFDDTVAECPECGEQSYRSSNIFYSIVESVDEVFSKIKSKKEST